MNHEAFWRSWFGLLGGREVGSPYRRFIPDTETFLPFLSDCSRSRLPCYMSVQRYSGINTPCTLEKLFFDFDCKNNPEKAITEAQDFAEKIKRFYGAKPLLVFSGAKGCHVYLWVHGLEFLPAHIPLVKEAYRRLQLKVLKGFHYETVDPQPLGDLARLARVPYTLHEKSGRLCEPLTVAQDLEEYRRNGLPGPLLKTTLQEAKLALQALEERKTRVTPFRGATGVRRQVRALIEKAQRGVRLEHQERLAIVCELISAGKSDGEIVQVFLAQDDFNESKTRYFVEHARKRGYQPFRLKTLQEASP